MPIYLDVQPRLDDRAAKRAADDATKHFSDAGKTVGQQFSENLSRGLSSSDAAFRKSAENAEKVYKRAQDAAGAARVEAAKYDDVLSKGTGGTVLLAQTEKLEKARRAEVSTTREAVVAFRALNDAQDAVGASAGRLHQTLSGLTTGALASNSFIRRQDVTNIEGMLSGLSVKAVAATAGIAGLAVGVGAAVTGLYDLGKAWDAVGDNITGRTGIMGDQLNVITESVKKVGSQSALSFEDIGKFAGGVATSLHLTGDAATAMTQKLADVQQVTQQVVDTKDLGKAFRLFDVTDVNTEIQTLQQLTAASQTTQIPINDLLTTLGNTGKASKEAGLNLQQTLGVLLTLEDAGVSFDKAGPALSIALKNWSKDGRDANVALAETITQIKKFVDAGNDPAAAKLASQTFGRGYIDFLDAIKGGALDVDNLTSALEKLGATGDLIGDQKKATEDWAEGWQKLKHSAESFLQPVADFLFSNVNQPLLLAQQNVQGLSDKFAGLSGEIAGVKVTADSLATSLGLPGMPGAPGAAPPAGPPLPTTAPGQSTTGLGPNFYRDWYKTPEELKKEQAEQAKLPTAPAVTYDTSLPPGYAGVPQTSEMVGAENSWMDARHTLAEKQARLDQLENDHNAKADDITKAKNDVINAQQGQTQAELKLNDARQSLYEKSTKQLKGYADQMGQIGVALDKDLGLSKGLPGLADNLVRFIGSLAAAPLLGPLAAISAAQGGINATGSGLVGIAAAQGAFGQQYTPAGQAASAAASGGGRRGSGPSAVLGPDGTVSMQQLGPGGAYGVPAGSNVYTGPHTDDTGGAIVPRTAALEQVIRQNFPGAQVGRDYAPPDKYHEHSSGEALDIMVGANQQLGNQINQFLQDNAGALGLQYDLWQQQQWTPGSGPSPMPNRGSPTENHMDHIHARVQPGAMPFGPNGTPTNATDAANFSSFGDPGSPQAIANMIYQQAIGRGYSQHEAVSIVAYAQGESSMNPGSAPGAQGGSGSGNEVQGLFQEKPAFASAGGITPSQRLDPVANTTAYLNNLEAHRNLPIEQALPATSSGGPLATGPGSAPQPWGPLMSQAQNYLGFSSGGGIDTVPAMLAPGEHVLTRDDVKALGGQQGVYAFRNALHFDSGGRVPYTPTNPGTPGTNPLNVFRGNTPAAPPPQHADPTPAAPVAVQHLPPGSTPGQGIPAGPPLPPFGTGQGTGPAPGPSDPMIGGRDKPAIPGGGASSGAGLLQTATAIGAGAADMFAPGSGAAVQIGSQEIQRAIKFAGQATAIGVGGLMDTFLPTGGSDLANNSWITRIAGGFAGVAPQIPNLAGKSASGDAMQKGPQAPAPMALPPPLSSGQGTGTAPGPAMQQVPTPAQPQQQEPAHFATGGAVRPSINLTYNNNGATEDRAGVDLTHHLNQMYENMPGQR